MTLTDQPTVVAQPRVTNRFAIAAFVLGILGFFTSALGLLFAPIAVSSLIFGIIALRRINVPGEDSQRVAIAGLVLSTISMLVFAGVLAPWTATPVLG